eukprot:scaffold29115_cov56-Attheya_sp.AAC.6
MGAVIKQNGRPVAYFLRKLCDAQLNYTTVEKETLSIVECLREGTSLAFILRTICGCTFTYIPGPDNVIADAFSRVPRSSEEESLASKTGVANTFAIELDDLEMLDCFLTYPIFNDEDPQEYPLDYQTIQHYQQNDECLQAVNKRLPIKFPRIQVTNRVELIVYQKELNVPWRIALPDAILDRFIKWYHETLVHIGINQTEDTINTHFSTRRYGNV